MYYFGYGSNMAARVMKRVCPTHRLIGSARLDDYRLAFTRYSTSWGGGVADVVEKAGAHVWGRLYAIDTHCLSALDLKESYGTGYTRFECQVITLDERVYTAITYAVIDKFDGHIPPAPDYKATFLEGAVEADFPEVYMAFLRAVQTT